MADLYPVDPQFAAGSRYDKATYGKLYAESVADPDAFRAGTEEAEEETPSALALPMNFIIE